MKPPKFTDEEILEAIQKAGEHPTVRGVAEALRARGVEIADGTVQVYLNKLMEAGKIVRTPEAIVGKHPAWLYEVRP